MVFFFEVEGDLFSGIVFVAGGIDFSDLESIISQVDDGAEGFLSSRCLDS